MPLSNKDLSDIAQEFATSKADQADDKAAIPNIQEQVDKKADQAKRLYILYNDAHVERITPYETEHRWIDGTTYTTITQSQIETFGADTGKATYFYPLSWTKSNAMLQPNGNGNPKTTSTFSEQAVLNDTLENRGVIATINTLRNGQSSGATSRILDLSYSPGATTLTFTLAHTFTNGNLLWVHGSGTSALVRVTGTTSLTVDISELISPAGTIAAGGTAAANVPGFTNSERQTLTSVNYQRILTQLTTSIDFSLGLYNTALGNQLVQLKINIDQPSQITAAKTSVTNAQTAYTTWNSLSATGVGGKWTDTPLNDITTSYNSRLSGISARVSQITTALGVVSQNGEGEYSGNGNYLQRYKCLNFLINPANGPLQQQNGLKSAKGNFEQKVANTADKLATFSNLVRYTGFTKDAVGNTITVDGAAQFAPSDSVLLSGTDLPSIECTIVSVSGTSIVLSIVVPKQYTKASKSGIIKRV